MSIIQYETERLILRSWKDSDRDTFAQMNADPAVMEYFHELYSREKSDEIIDYSNKEISEHGFGFWAVERKDTNQFIGFIGLHRFDVDLPFCPCIEVGWRLAREQWGQGFATEGAKQCLVVGFENLSLDAIYAMTAIENQRSKRVMSKIGMRDTGQNFLHPSVPSNSRVQEHMLFKIEKKHWKNEN